MASTPITVVNITASSYSGATWLALMLASHSQGLCIGEMWQRKPFCTVHGEQCPLWSGIDYPFDRDLFNQLAHRTGKSVMVIKNNRQEFLDEQSGPGTQYKVIHLVRDGRAVTASYLRKHPELSMWSAARKWAYNIKRSEKLRRYQGKQDQMMLIYEQVKADPQQHLRTICEFLNIEFEPAMLNYWEHPHHYLFGNRGTLFSMLRQTDPEAELPENVRAKADWDLKHYENNNPSNFQDERWKKELSPLQRATFALAAGIRNRRLGY